MRIGLIRHFPVTEPMPRGWLNSSDLQEWRHRYDAADVIATTIDTGETDWRVCISSDLPRAYRTAQAAFTGEIRQTPQLREPEFAEFATGRLRLPPTAWKMAMMLAWLSGHSSQRAFRDDFKHRVRTIADELTAMNENVLVVSHAGMMSYLARELKRRGFTDPSFRVAHPAELYLFER